MSPLSRELQDAVKNKIFNLKESFGCIKAEQAGFDSHLNLNTLVSQLWNGCVIQNTQLQRQSQTCLTVFWEEML